METIIGLLVILLPVIFKVIGRKFEQSGQNGKAGKMKELSEIFSEDYADVPEYELMQETVTPVAPDPVPESFDVKQPEPKTHEAVRNRLVTAVSPARKHSRTSEEKKSSEHEKIDPKKLVIYSEIMKPKF